VATPKQGIRIPQDRFSAAQARARAGRTDASKVVNALLVLYLRGVLDDALRPLLFPSLTASASATGQDGQAPS
jgi:hypothetical protein